MLVALPRGSPSLPGSERTSVFTGTEAIKDLLNSLDLLIIGSLRTLEKPLTWLQTCM